MIRNSKRGFTLFEVLTVVSIVGYMVAAAAPELVTTTTIARKAVFKSQIAAIVTAADLYRASRQGFSATADESISLDTLVKKHYLGSRVVLYPQDNGGKGELKVYPIQGRGEQGIFPLNSPNVVNKGIYITARPDTNHDGLPDGREYLVYVEKSPEIALSEPVRTWDEIYPAVRR
ncbi:MAG: type II secretion system protein [Candidatus Wallbacteria bacterium]|nr:type II secretion system protein [Candidatus Wallbacteria bacterium]